MASLIKRNGTYYVQWYVGKCIRRQSLRTDSYQIAKAKLAQCQVAHAQGSDSPLPTRTPIPTVLTAYVGHIRATKSPKSAQNDIYYLREAFGPCCQALRITSRRPTPKARRRPARADDCGRRTIPPIEAPCFEAITPQQIATFIETKIRRQGIRPKTANHYRSIIRRVFNWAMKQNGIRTPDRRNPAAAVEPYREKARPIRYLTLAQIDEQLNALIDRPTLQTMVATLIYAGLRRAELLWLTLDDVDLPPGAPAMLRIRPKHYHGIEWTPKTGVARVVPISTALRPYLERHAPRPSDGPGRGWLFPSPQSTRWDEDNFSADLRLANGEHGLIWSSLDYRHTFGSQLAQKGVSLYKISQLMGNSPEICRRHYAALVPEAMLGEVEFRKVHTVGLSTTA
jgi:integrase